VGRPRYKRKGPKGTRGKWTSRRPCCRVCGTTKREHSAKGCCHGCYMKERRALGHVRKRVRKSPSPVIAVTRVTPATDRAKPVTANRNQSTYCPGKNAGRTARARWAREYDFSLEKEET
jgi:hypothetical protein